MKKIEAVSKKYIGFQVFFSLLLWIPVFYEVQKRAGLNDAQIFTIQSIYYWVFCFLEIPTGYLADRLGHRHCMKIGSIVVTIANLLPVFAPGYAGFLGSFLGLALARALISGASSAYLYDFLQQEGESHLYKKIEGRARAWGLVAKVVGWSAIGPLMQWQDQMPYTATAIMTALSVMYAWQLPPLASHFTVGSEPRQWRRAVRLIIERPALSLVMLQGAAIFVLGRVVQLNLFQPILNAKGMGVSVAGLMMSTMTVFEAVGSAFPRPWGWSRVSKTDSFTVFLLTLVSGSSVLALAWGHRQGTVLGFCIFAGAMGMCFPIQKQLLNDVIPDSKVRATLLSVESMIDRALCAWVASLAGSAVAAGSVEAFLQTSAWVTLGWVGSLTLLMAVNRIDNR